MAKKRMFDRAIIDTDKFMDMGMPAKALYFLLGMEADDEGFVSYKKILRVHGGNEDDVKILIAKNFIIPFPSGVVVITDWNKNNWLDSRRVNPTEYQKEKNMLILTENKEYVLSIGFASIEEKSIEEKSAALSDKSPGIQEIIKAFEAIDAKNKTYYGNKTQRKAAQFLINEYGIETVLHVIENVLPKTNIRPRYEFPHISDADQLMKCWAKIKNGITTKKVEQDKNKINIY